MKNLSTSNPRRESSSQTAQDDTQDDAQDLLHSEQIFRSLREPRRETPDEPTDEDDTARLPNITSLPAGMEVVEQDMRRAVGQWFLLVRCQCGRRWFELEAIDTATCPRCNSLVYVDVLEKPRD